MVESRAPVRLEYARPDPSRWGRLVLSVMAIAGVHTAIWALYSGLESRLGISTYTAYSRALGVIESILTPMTQLLLKSNVGFGSLTESVFLIAFALDGLLYGTSATLLYLWIKGTRVSEPSQTRRGRKWTRMIMLGMAVLWGHHLLYWFCHWEALASVRALHWAVSPLCELVAHSSSSRIPLQYPALLDSLVYGFVIALCTVWLTRSRGRNVHGSPTPSCA